jgi:hypothetical protein
MDPEDQTRGAFDGLIKAGERLIAALAEEQRVSAVYPEDISQVFAYLETVSAARKRVDECAAEYRKLLVECGSPDLPIRREIERTEKRRALGWRPENAH